MAIERYVKITWLNGQVEYVPEYRLNSILLQKYNDDLGLWETLGDYEVIYVLTHDGRLFKLDELSE